MSITNLSLLQGFCKVEKKQNGKTYSPSEKAALIHSIENKSKREVERELAAIQPALITKDKERALTPNLTEIRLVADERLMQKLNRVREVLAHVNPSLSYAEMLHKMTDEFLERRDPVKKAERVLQKAVMKPVTKAKEPTSPAKPEARAPRTIPASVRHEVWTRDSGTCTYIHESRGKACRSKFGLELDHVHPHTWNGENTVENLRLRCRLHNQLHAKDCGLDLKALP